jgi:aromatic-L-amino-acid decarboxylase
MNTICFRYKPDVAADSDSLNERLLETVNATGKLYLTHTKLNGVYTIRLVIAQTHVRQRHADEAWELIVKTAREELKP